MAKIAVIAGGYSLERSISIESGIRANSALLELGHQSLLLDPGSDLIERLDSENFELAFIALHGRGGEDGTIQDLFEAIDFPYTGSAAAASALAADKHLFKSALRKEGISTANWHSLTRQALTNFGGAAVVNRLVADLGLPVIVKPASEGSSFGISRVDKEEELVAALSAGFAYDDRVIIEEWIEGEELALTLLGTAQDCRVLPALRIETDQPFYTFSAHYNTGEARLSRAELSPELLGEVEAAAKAAYRRAGCRDFARADLIIDSNGQPQLLELNTIPGMTPTGPTPVAADFAGLEFVELVEEITSRALAQVLENSSD